VTPGTRIPPLFPGTTFPYLAGKKNEKKKNQLINKQKKAHGKKKLLTVHRRSLEGHEPSQGTTTTSGDASSA